jgi:hypothetical protein
METATIFGILIAAALVGITALALYTAFCNASSRIKRSF